jgi:hypothetical protein
LDQVLPGEQIKIQIQDQKENADIEIANLTYIDRELQKEDLAKQIY